MNILNYKILAFKQLLENCKDCQEYDGYSAEDQLEYFIRQNGYNPIGEVSILGAALSKEILPDELIRDHYNIEEIDFSISIEVVKAYADKVTEYLKDDPDRKIKMNFVMSHFSYLRSSK